MLQLCGFAASNYHNKVKLALLEKEIPFEEIAVFPSKDPAVLAESPMGKMPFLRTERGPLAESQVILEYLEDAWPRRPLYPSDPFERARVRELISILELHLELVVRRLYAQAFFGGKVSDGAKADVESQLRRGLAALARRTDCSAFMAGDAFGAADCAAAMHLPTLAIATREVLGRDLLAECLPAAKDYLKRVGERPTVARVHADRKAGTAAFMSHVARRSAS